LYLETVGAVTGYKSFLGVMRKGLIPATSYGQNKTILEELASAGVDDVRLKLLGWFNGSYKHAYPSKISLNKELGSKNEFKELQQTCSDLGFGLYPDVDFLTTYVGKNGFNPSVDAAMTLDAYKAGVLDKSYATGHERWWIIPVLPQQRIIISPRLITDLAQQFINAQKARLDLDGLSLRTTGSELYADFRENAEYDRQHTRQIVLESMAAFKEGIGSIMINTGHLYALKYADNVTNISIDNNWYYAEDEAIPFYQMVMHGYVSMGSRPVNLEPDTAMALLRCIEYGVSPAFQVCYEDPSVMQGTTDFNDNFSAGYQNWKDRIVKGYKMVSGALNKVSGAVMTGHRTVKAGVYETRYDNGVSVYVNYNSEAAEADGLTIDAGSYAVKER